jgi:tetratricopeptide (TPR) repeat protein
MHVSEPALLGPEQLASALSAKLAPPERLLVENPFATTTEMENWAQAIAVDADDEEGRAKRLFSALTAADLLRQDAASYTLGATHGPFTADQAFAHWLNPHSPLSCQDYTLLYVAMARNLGLRAYYVLVTRDYRGRPTYHSCAGVLKGHDALLVDASNSWFGVPHCECQFLDDVQAIALLLSQRADARKQAVATKLAGGLAVVHLNRSLGLAESGRTREAREALNAGLRLDPPAWLGLYARAVIEWHERDPKSAAQHFQDCLQINPEYPEARSALAQVLRQKGRPARSRAEQVAPLQEDAPPPASGIGLAPTLK